MMSKYTDRGAEQYLDTAFDAITCKCDGNVMGQLLHSSLRQSLATPPAATTARVNTLKYCLGDAQSFISSEYKGYAADGVITHPDIPDMIALQHKGPRTDLVQQRKKIIVGIQCGNSVLRGANVYAPGVLGAPKNLSKGDYVSVYSDIDMKCLKGTAREYDGETMFVGNGVAIMNREELFGSSRSERGCAIEMVDGLYSIPSLHDFEDHDMLFLQNLPSIVVSHVLNPQPGHRVLDMCAAPGGKTVHIATLMRDKGVLIALDKSAAKVHKIQQILQRFHITCTCCFVYDATKCCSEMEPAEYNDAPPFPPGSFDRILLDAPCSALGQRPQFTLTQSIPDLQSYPHYQQKMLKQAVGLLKIGGELVYSTCTYTPEENECQVQWVLQEFKDMQLVEQYPKVGFSGLPGFGLEEKDLKKLQRFWPYEFTALLDKYVSDTVIVSDHKIPLLDTIAFFIAKFIKVC